MAFSTVIIVFVFMLLLPEMLQSHHGGISVDVPKVRHPIALRERRLQDTLLVTITSGGSVLFGTDQMLPTQLPAAIKQAISRGVERRVYIRADARTKYGNVVEVLDSVRSAGIQNITFFVTEQTAR